MGYCPLVEGVDERGIIPVGLDVGEVGTIGFQGGRGRRALGSKVRDNTIHDSQSTC